MKPPANISPKRANRLVQWFDVSFIMVLCFVTLLTTMVVHGKVLVGSGDSAGLDHSFNAPIFLAVAAIFALYLWYMLRHSERELRELVDHVYGKRPPGDVAAVVRPWRAQGHDATLLRARLRESVVVTTPVTNPLPPGAPAAPKPPASGGPGRADGK